jgi:hypothetical protein
MCFGAESAGPRGGENRGKVYPRESLADQTDVNVFRSDYWQYLIAQLTGACSPSLWNRIKRRCEKMNKRKLRGFFVKNERKNSSSGFIKVLALLS